MPPDQLGRIAFHAVNSLGGAVSTNTDGSVRYTTPNRLLTSEQLHLIYQRTPDVRAGFDQIARVVSTQDWMVEVTGLDPSDDGYEAALEVAEATKQFLQTPNANDWTWQEVLVAWVTDLLKFDRGPVELCRGRDGLLEEIVPVRGGSIMEVVDEHGRLQHYKQVPEGIFSGDLAANEVVIDTDDMLMLQLYRTTEGPGGLPILESLVNEIVAILRSSEYIALALDLNEIPPGLMVVSGLAQQAIDRFRAEMASNRNRDWKFRMLFNPGKALGPVDARWVQFQRAPRENQIAELSKEIRRTIWRVIGVMPVTMGDTERTPRATAEVQMDASASHLITPILELLQAKVNSRIVPMLVPEEFFGLIEFRFKTERDLSELEKKDRADRLTTLTSAGIITVDEARAELGFDPIEDEEEEEESTTPSPDASNGPDDDVPDSPGEGNEAAEEDAGRRVKRRASDRLRRARTRAKAKAAARVLRRRFGVETHPYDERKGGCTKDHVHGPECSHSHRSFEPEDLPSGWQPDSHFRDYRTVDLPALGTEIAGYAVDVEPLWEQARTMVISAVASQYVAEGFDSERRQLAMQAVSDYLSKLMVDWAITTSGRYTSVAEVARNSTADWVTNPMDIGAARDMAGAYRDRAMGYLTDAGGPIHTVERRVLEVLVQVSDVRSRPSKDLRRGSTRAAPLTPGASPQEVLQRVGDIFDAQKFRIKNWSGRLVELAYQVVDASLANAEEARTRGKGHAPRAGHAVSRNGSLGAQTRNQTTEWWVEWVAVHDRGTCPTCDREGLMPMRPLSSLPTFPGGATECKARCRCILVYWTREEVFGGQAERLGNSEPFDPDNPTPANPTGSTGPGTASTIADEATAADDATGAGAGGSGPSNGPVTTAQLDDAAAASRQDIYDRPWLSTDPEEVLRSIDLPLLSGPEWLEGLASMSDEALVGLVDDIVSGIRNGVLRSGAQSRYVDDIADLYWVTVNAQGSEIAREVAQTHVMKALRAIRARMVQRDLTRATRALGGDWSYDRAFRLGSPWELDTRMIHTLEQLGYGGYHRELAEDVIVAIRTNDRALMRTLVARADEIDETLELEIGLFMRARQLDDAGRELMARALEEWLEAGRLNRFATQNYGGFALQETMREYRTSESFVQVFMNEGVERNTSVMLEVQRIPANRRLFSGLDVSEYGPNGADLQDLAPRMQGAWDWGYVQNNPQRNEMIQSVIWQSDGILQLPSAEFAADALYPPLSILDHGIVQGARLRAFAMQETASWTPDAIHQVLRGLDPTRPWGDLVPGTHWYRGIQVGEDIANAIQAGQVLDFTGLNAMDLDFGKAMDFARPFDAPGGVVFRMDRSTLASRRSLTSAIDGAEHGIYEVTTNARRVRVIDVTTATHPETGRTVTLVDIEIVE